MHKHDVVFPVFVGLLELNIGIPRLPGGPVSPAVAKQRLKKIEAAISNPSARQTQWTSFWSHLLLAEISLAEGRIEQAIAAGEKISLLSPPGLEYTDWILKYNYPSLKDVLARACIQKGDIDGAVAEYERLTTFDPESEARNLIHPKNYYRLARLYERKGWTGKAIENYEKFLNLWSEADPGLPEVEEAKKRLLGLRVR